MVPSTMTSLRNVTPLAATAAILPNYELCFDIPGHPFIEPSAASVQRNPRTTTTTTTTTTSSRNDMKCVHGVLYTLTEDDFVTVGRSEGVPLTYIWERCHPIPYIGNNANAGQEALLLQQQQEEPHGPSATEEAFVLTANPLFRSKPSNSMIPPSQSYLQILRDGSKYWNMDRSYQMYLQNEIPTNPIVPGISKQVLQWAEQMNPKPNLYISSRNE